MLNFFLSIHAWDSGDHLQRELQILYSPFICFIKLNSCFAKMDSLSQNSSVSLIFCNASFMSCSLSIFGSDLLALF